VPFDVWGEPLPAFTFGDLPEPVLKGWAEHLVSEQVRSRCSDCKKLHAPPGQECPLHLGPLGATMAIYCLPLSLGERRLGMVNLYLSPGQVLDAGAQRFLEGLLDQMALAVEALRLRDQEFSLLRHLHNLRSPRGELSVGLEALLDSARQAVGADGLSLQVRPMMDERISNLLVQAGTLPLDAPEALEPALNLALQEGKPQQAAEDGLDWVVEPVMLPEGQVLGTLFALRRAQDGLSANRWTAVRTVAAQAALMIENERVTLSLEYSLVIQERTRLAREIHDGLAQTLAFLKMQSAQMQAAVNQGDQARLSRLLQENRAALADAYKETRQAIDNLRLSPDEGLLSWINQAARDFEKACGIQVVVAAASQDVALVPEIQAHLVRIVQEALNNVRKHAHAESVRISFRRWENDLILEVVDNGNGFDPEDVPLAAQYGLRGMRERAELIGAEFQITSQPACGTTVRVFIPAQIQEIGK
jgi:two-component system nitrate/nitrite sensor histidine kinase NarX